MSAAGKEPVWRPAPARVLLKLGYACNNNCAFCHSSPHRGTELETQQVIDKVEQARGLGATGIVLSGGEPTIRADLQEIAEHIRASGLSLGLITNGRMLAYPVVLEGLLQAGLDYVHLSLCAPQPALHDRLVRAHAFHQVLQAITHCAGKVTDFTINAVVTAPVLECLPDYAGILRGLSGIRLKFSFVEPEGNALDDFDGLVPMLDDAARQVAQVVDGLAQDFPGIGLAVDGFPLCKLDGLEHLESGLREDGFFGMSEAFEPGIHPIDDRHRGFGQGCVGCSLRRRCRGLYKIYLERRGEAELVPLSRPVSNAFRLEPVGQPEALDLRACPIRSGQRPPPGLNRGLLVRTRGVQAQRMRTDTRDFSDETLERTIRERGLLYRPPPSSAPVTDFATQLKPLVLAPACERCPRRQVCGGLWRVGPQGCFDGAMDMLARRLDGLTGQVLDVGCGAAPYTAGMENAIGSGRLTYLGIDPSPDARAPAGGELRRLGLEDFAWAGAPFDAVLAVRSLNHLPSPASSLARLAQLTRPGGKLLLAEDVVFGVARFQADPASAADQARPDYEHLLNLELSEARALAEDVGLQKRFAAGPKETRSTLWILELERD